METQDGHLNAALAQRAERLLTGTGLTLADLPSRLHRRTVPGRHLVAPDAGIPAHTASALEALRAGWASAAPQTELEEGSEP